MSFRLTFCDASGPTPYRDAATHVIIRHAGMVVMTLAHVTHPRYGVRGYTLMPPPRVFVPGLGYRPAALAAGHLPDALQQRMWVDPDAPQPADTTRDPASWDTLDDLTATLKPLLR